GEAVAAGCAESAAQAAGARDLGDVGYQPLPVPVDPDPALAPPAPPLPDEAPRHVLFPPPPTRGGVGRGVARAHPPLAATVSHARCSASPLEARGLVASWEGERLTVWCGTQTPHLVRTALARAFRLREDQVRVIVPDTGGGFGQKMYVLPEEAAVAALARVSRRPVKWIETRRENLAAATQARE